MHKKFVKVKNVQLFASAMERLKNARPGIPRMALCEGEFGLGRTDTALWYAAQNDDVKFIRLVSLINGPWLLSTIIAELGHFPARKISDRFQQCINILFERQQILIFDEVDYILGDRSTIETLRDLHDITGTVIVFVCMKGAESRLKRYPHLNDRIMERIRFDNLSLEDVKKAAGELCEVPLTSDAIAHLHSVAPRFRLLIKEIYKCEAMAKASGLKEVKASDLAGAKR